MAGPNKDVQELKISTELVAILKQVGGQKGFNLCADAHVVFVPAFGQHAGCTLYSVNKLYI